MAQCSRRPSSIELEADRSLTATGTAYRESVELPRRWFVGVRVWPSTAILFTDNDDGLAAENFAEAIAIFGSIELDAS
jgi:hypothetical protein